MRQLKQISSYNVLNGIVRFKDGEARYFTKESADMISRLLHALARESNFRPVPELTSDEAVDVAVDMINTEK